MKETSLRLYKKERMM